MAEITLHPHERALTRLNGLSAEAARRELLTCCAATDLADSVAASRPYESLDDLLNASDDAIAKLTENGIAEALAAHPRIGQRADGEGREADWSRREQSGAADASPAVKRALAEGNAAYEQRFDQVFLICAAGLSAETMLADLHTRLGNDPATERAVVREELRKITRLRLRKLVDS
ncbi:MAG: 2-oxo-4-hydroxy-4-carboxy-5-ureidoimidazoline decarboxylase [Actinophytocola sp.]|nr:2-oxo-4-hydroxy-4-carboxy-5-ureidoimidazoline decarboxylase [Actinophytocola sp.]